METSMSWPDLPWQGGCRCGQVRFQVTAPPLLTMACHCTGCQRMTASAFSLSIALPAEGLAVTRGEPVIGGLHGSPRHFFCPHCMSWLFSRPDRMTWLVLLRATMLDEPGWFTPFIESWTSEKLPWATTPARHSFEGFPTLEDYEGLTKDFAAWAGRKAG